MKQSMRKATIRDVADMAGVSVTTVSLVLNNKGKSISADTIKRVKESAQSCHYSASPIAASMITKKTQTIGYIIPDIQNIFFSQIAKNVETEMNKVGYNLILCNSDDRYDRDLHSILSLANRQIDLLIFAPSAESLKAQNVDNLYHVLSNLEIPYIIVDRDLGDKPCHKIVNDHEFGGYLATRYLIDQGHTNIACISGPLEVSSAQYRYRGYVNALQEAGITVIKENLYEGDYYFDSGYKIANQIFTRKEVTAVFASNDLMAYGVLKAAREANVKIPDDLSLVGFDDLYFSSILDVPLTSVKQDIDKISKGICNFIVQELDTSKDKTRDFITEMIQPSITIRKSVKKI